MASCVMQEPFLSANRKETVLELRRKATRGGIPLTPQAKWASLCPLQSPLEFTCLLPRPTLYGSCVSSRTFDRWLAGLTTRQRRERKRSLFRGRRCARRHKLHIVRLRLARRRLIHSAAPPFQSKATCFALSEEEGGNIAQFSSFLTETERRELLLTPRRVLSFLKKKRKNGGRIE